MELAELQTAFDQLTAEHAALVAEKADLQLRFNATASFILDLRKQLAAEKSAHAATTLQRDTYKKGFETQTAAHHDAAARADRLRKGLPENPVVMSSSPSPEDPSNGPA